MKEFKENVKKFIVYVIGMSVALIVFVAIGWYATSASVWNADKHDSNCEGSGHCHCYERMNK